ncbi:recombinase family protein [uncultured Roseibium sp.]|uniref:recombinase family protein n=1 Tax=uncultured Roseibium sp. TaxID=1936171 RepID=UPI0026336798|nr:recombinase family protein [uncultured Roseibium sp.]
MDATTPAGKVTFQMMGVFAEFERAMIRDRVNYGLARARRRSDPRSPEAGQSSTNAIRSALVSGDSVRKVATAYKVSVGKVQRFEDKNACGSQSAQNTQSPIQIARGVEKYTQSQLIKTIAED